MTWVMKNEKEFARWRRYLNFTNILLEVCNKSNPGNSSLKVRHSHTGYLLILFIHSLIQ